MNKDKIHNKIETIKKLEILANNYKQLRNKLLDEIISEIHEKTQIN